MPSRCVIAGCSNCTKDGVSLHKFPSDPKYRRVWMAKVNQAQWTGATVFKPTEHSMICSTHFESTCFDRGLYSQFGIKIKQMLLPDAIPTIFSLSKKAKKKRGAFTKREKIRELKDALGEENPRLFSARYDLHTSISSKDIKEECKDDKQSKESVAKTTDNSDLHKMDERKPVKLKKDTCAAFGCSHRRNIDGCTFHHFPKDKEIRDKWIKASRCNIRKDGKTMKKPPSCNILRLCRCHFEQTPYPRSAVPRLRNIVPMIFRHTSKRLKTTTQPARKARKSRMPQAEPQPLKNTLYPPDLVQSQKDVLSQEAYKLMETCDPGFWKDYNQLQEELMLLRATCRSYKLLNLQNIKHDDGVFETYTGLPNYATFVALHEYLELNAKSLQRARTGIVFGKLYVGDKQTPLTTEDQLFVFLVRIKTGSSASDLAIRFGVSTATFSVIISSWAIFVSLTLDEFYKTTATPSETSDSKEGNILVAIDCTPLFSKSPALLVNHRYDPNSTRRLLVADIDTRGVVTRVLNTLRGHASTKVESNNMTHFSDETHPQSGAYFMDSRGVQIGKNLPRPIGANTLRVVSLKVRNSDMALMSTIETFHVERALDRIKRFHYLQQQVELSQLDTYEHVFKACAYLSNFQCAL